MPMFDYVEYEAPCWRCGLPIRTWQSKDGDCEGHTLKPDDVLNFYAHCQTCGAWNEFVRVVTPEFVRATEREQQDSGPDIRLQIPT